MSLFAAAVLLSLSPASSSLTSSRVGFSWRAAAAPGGGVARAAAPGGARRAQSLYGGGWPTEHHDARNTGVTTSVGPISSGECASNFFAGSIADSVSFYSSGVSAESRTDASDFANAHFFGGGDNVARFVNKRGGNVSEWACPVAKFSGTGAAVAGATYGFVASPEAWSEEADLVDRVAFASSDGNVYALDWQGCSANTSVCKYTSFIVPSVLPGGADADAVAAGKGVRGG
jgi:hypothetical protein